MTSQPNRNLLLSSPLTSANVAALLKIKILSWSQETGFPVCINVRVADKTFNLHKQPLTRKSGYFREKLTDSSQVELPSDFPGGPETFETIVLFMYGSSTLVDPFNVASLRCASQFLLMTEEYCPGNLCDRFDVYLNQVVLQNWDDTLIVLQRCRALLPWAEQLLIVSRCIETLAFMACMEILDPERRRDQPVVTLETLACKEWTDKMVRDVLSKDTWIKDLIALPLMFFKRVIVSLRRQGMREKYVSPIILLYADRWVSLGQNRKNRIEEDEGFSDSTKNDLTVVLQGIVDLLLPTELKSSKLPVVPVGFYFSLLAKSMELGLRDDSIEKLLNQIASVLHLAQVKDFLKLNHDNGDGLCITERLFSTYFSGNIEANNRTHAAQNHAVAAELWDIYLNQIANDSKLDGEKFMNLIEIVPDSSRRTHDHLYMALNTFFLSHPTLSQEDKGSLCKYLDCHKLSQEICIEAVQNNVMPLRFIIQALFLQQLNTQQVFKECSDSFRYTYDGREHYYSGSLSSSRVANSRSRQILNESPCTNMSEGTMSLPMSYLLDRDLSTREKIVTGGDISREDYESTSMRIQNLGRELVSLKKSLKIQQVSQKRDDSTLMANENLSGSVRGMRKKKCHNVGQVTSCMGTVSFASQRRYANRLLKMIRRLSLLGIRGRSVKK